MTRRGVLRSAGTALMGVVAASCGPAPRPGRPAGAVEKAVEKYGRARLNRGEWLLPADGAHLRVVVLVHGGFWQPGYDRHLEDAVAVALVDRGFAVWNIDYRSAADAWPATFEDADAAVEHLASSRYRDRLDLARVAVVGHSAGGHLALWLASRSQLPANAVGARPRVGISLAIGQAPVADLVGAAEQGVGGGAVMDLMDAGPEDAPARYAVGSPQALLPVPDVRIVLLHGDADGNVPLRQSQGYADAAAAAGTRVALRVLRGVGHFEHLDPRSTAMAAALKALEHG